MKPSLRTTLGETPAGLILRKLNDISGGAPSASEAPPRRFARDEAVTITDGLNKGMSGVVRSRGSVMFGPHPTWVVDFGGLLGLRTIREDYLARSDVRR